MGTYVADFETINDKNDCRVWLAAILEIGTNEVAIYNNLDDFMENIPSNSTIYFHNLRFDGEFILNWLFRNGFVSTRSRNIEKNQVYALVDDMRKWYTVKFNNGTIITLIDSLKIIPLPVEKIPKAFGLEECKGSINYNAERPLGYTPTPEEIEYVKHDVIIVAKALQFMFDNKLKKITQGANALADYKNIIGSKRFQKAVPIANV